MSLLRSVISLSLAASFLLFASATLRSQSPQDQENQNDTVLMTEEYLNYLWEQGLYPPDTSEPGDTGSILRKVFVWVSDQMTRGANDCYESDHVSDVIERLDAHRAELKRVTDIASKNILDQEDINGVNETLRLHRARVEEFKQHWELSKEPAETRKLAAILSRLMDIRKKAVDLQSRDSIARSIKSSAEILKKQLDKIEKDTKRKPTCPPPS